RPPPLPGRCQGVLGKVNTLGNVFKHLFGFCFLGDVRLRGQTGVPAERRGSYPFIDFRLLNSE
uniref:Uncharacterized protein n=1 Tax=Sus scrofa TaxID=9823 RepID=A0A8D1I4Y7_PIG